MLLTGCQFGSQPVGQRVQATPSPAVSGPAGVTYPAVAPAGVPPVVGDGALAVLPQGGDGTPLPVTAELGNGWVATVLVAADPLRSIVVRLQVVSAETLALSPPDGTAMALSIDMFDATTGARIPTLAGPPAVGIRTPTAVDAVTVALWQLDESTRAYQQVAGSLDDSGRIISAWLPNASSQTIVLALPAAMHASVAPTAPVQTAVASAALQPAATVTAQMPPRAPLPARLTIASIGVDAPIEAVGLEPSGIMASPTQGHVVGWYELGPRPGEFSNAILAGHVDLNKQPGVFLRLPELQSGAVIDVDTGLGIAYRYLVEDVRTYRAADAPIAEVFGPTEKPTLTLITCGGEFDQSQRAYVDRIVVRARGA
jgi:sortase (surface protein transpeptidase)